MTGLKNGTTVPYMEQIKQILCDSALNVLRPLIRILLKHGVSHSEFQEIARRAYVDVAYHDYAAPGRKRTVSRASVVTGLSRKEVLRIRKETEVKLEKAIGPVNRASQVMSGWFSDEEFLDKRKSPAVLPLKGKKGSFESLVKRYSGDITPRAILDELLISQAVEKTDIERVKIKSYGYIPEGKDIEKYSIMGDCAADLLETLSNNVSSEKPELRLQRSVAYSGLTESTVEEFQELSRDKCQQLIVELNQWLAERNVKKLDRIKDVKYKRAGIGIYYFENLIAKEKYNEKNIED